MPLKTALPPDRPVSLAGVPAVPYEATAFRPEWTELPRGVRAAIEAVCGRPVLAATRASSGFSDGFAAVLHLAGGEKAFCKATPAAGPLGAAYQTEALITAVLPDGVAAPRLRWHTVAAGHVIACYDTVPGAIPAGADLVRHLPAILDAHSRSMAAIRTAPPLLRTLARRRSPLPAGWQAVMSSPACLPPGAGGLRPWASLLAAYERRFLRLCASTDELAHLDLRPDNILIDGERADGEQHAWLVDWATLRPAPSWLDCVTLALAAAGEGLSPDAVMRSSGWAGQYTEDELDAALAWLCGSYLTFAARPFRPSSPYLRAHQLRNGLLAWRWLAGRRSLPVPGPAGTRTR